MHRVLQSETDQHLCLRQTELSTNFQEFFSQPHGTGTRVSHQKFPPDENCRGLCAVGSRLRSPFFFAVSMNLSCSTAMLITRYCGRLSHALAVAELSKTRAILKRLHASRKQKN